MYNVILHKPDGSSETTIVDADYACNNGSGVIFYRRRVTTQAQPPDPWLPAHPQIGYSGTSGMQIDIEVKGYYLSTGYSLEYDKIEDDELDEETE